MSPSGDQCARGGQLIPAERGQAQPVRRVHLTVPLLDPRLQLASLATHGELRILTRPGSLVGDGQVASM